MNDKTQGIRNYAKQKSENRQVEVLSIIKQMKKNGDKVTFYSVAKAANASKSYLYNNKTIATEIRSCREMGSTTRTDKSKSTVISMLRAEIKRLNRQLSELNSDSYKEKYEKVLEENKELKKQLEKAYTVW